MAKGKKAKDITEAEKKAVDVAATAEAERIIGKLAAAQNVPEEPEE